MVTKSSKKLSSVLGTYFTVSVIILTGAVLFFTYRLVIQTINTEIEKSFSQQHNIAENIFEWEAERLENYLQDIQSNHKFLNQLFFSKNQGAQLFFQQFIDKSTRHTADVVFISTSENPVWVDASSPVPDSKPILYDLAKKGRSLLLSAKVLHFKNKTSNLTGIFKSKKIILEDGQVVGILVSGTILNNNLNLINQIKHKTKSLGVTLIQESNTIASSGMQGLMGKNEAPATGTGNNEETQQSFRQDVSNGQLISEPFTINLFGKKTPVQIAFSMDDAVLGKIHKIYLRTLIFISILFVVFLIISLIAIRRLVYPSIQRILAFTKKIIEEDNIQSSIEPGSISELNVISSAMEKMVSAINEANTKLKASEAKYRRLAENSPDMIYRMSLPDGLYEYVSPAAETIFGYPPKSWYDNPLLIQNLIHPEYHENFKEKWEGLLKGEVSSAYEYQILYKGKETRWIHQRNVDVRDRNGKLVAIEGIVTDITDLKNSEKALQDSHNRFLTVLNSLDATIYVVDMQTFEVLFMNQYMIDSFGRDMTGELCWKAYKGGSKQCINCPNDKIVDKDGKPTGVYTWQTKNPVTGKWYINYDRAVKWTDGRIVKLQVASDITELKRMEDELRQAHKMESIGIIAGGIAHDFNNILSIIIGNTELAIEETPKSNPVHNNLEEIMIAGMRSRDIIKQLLSFSRKTDQTVQNIRILPIIHESIKLIRSSIPATIDIKLNEDDIKGVIKADPTQIHQILINLCTNAAHAMDEKGGVLTISLSEIELDRISKIQFQDVKPGRYIQLTIKDTGTGIDSSIVDKVFDPYFTTKKVGKGSGMGLAMVHGIVKNCNGSISVYSDPLQGTTFKILFPSADKEPAIVEKLTADDLTGNEKILLIDDEEAVAKMGATMLERMGYEVVNETNANKALDLIKAEPSRFDLIITDMTMPNMTGDKLAQKVLEIRQDMPIILCTGFSEKIDREKALKMGIRKYIDKPLNKTQLATAVRDVLSDSGE